MCGIVGYVGGQSALDVVIAGLKRLEYRGYDSAGVAVLADGATLGTIRVAQDAPAQAKGEFAIPGPDVAPPAVEIALAPDRWVVTTLLDLPQTAAARIVRIEVR